jgi:hypothetical protein
MTYQLHTYGNIYFPAYWADRHFDIQNPWKTNIEYICTLIKKLIFDLNIYEKINLRYGRNLY